MGYYVFYEEKNDKNSCFLVKKYKKTAIESG